MPMPLFRTAHICPTVPMYIKERGDMRQIHSFHYVFSLSTTLKILGTFRNHGPRIITTLSSDREMAESFAVLPSTGLQHPPLGIRQCYHQQCCLYAGLSVSHLCKPPRDELQATDARSDRCSESSSEIRTSYRLNGWPYGVLRCQSVP